MLIFAKLGDGVWLGSGPWYVALACRLQGFFCGSISHVLVGGVFGLELFLGVLFGVRWLGWGNGLKKEPMLRGLLGCCLLL